MVGGEFGVEGGDGGKGGRVLGLEWTGGFRRKGMDGWREGVRLIRLLSRDEIEVGSFLVIFVFWDRFSLTDDSSRVDGQVKSRLGTGDSTSRYIADGRADGF